MATSRHAAPRPLRDAALRRPAAPILKWAGGKGRLLGQLLPMLPPGCDLMRHVEPFVGGGAMFFARAPSRALLADVNPALIRTYEAVRDDVEAVIAQLERLAARHDSGRYYRVRDRYNKKRLGDAEHAATFLYLNKTCFNGLHRVNKKGEFNVPEGRYTRPRILDAEALRIASEALRTAEIRNAGFEALLEDARPGDFVYFDPPYEPVSPTASFTSYARDGFSSRDQERLRDVFRELDRRGCKLMLSNSDVPLIRELYRGYVLATVSAARAINSNGGGRGSVSELVVRNYAV